MIKQARISDVKQIARIINDHADKGLMLHIPLTQIYDQLRDFVVATDNDQIVGCGAVHIAWEGLGEIRSVAVAEECRNKGVGTHIVNALINMAREIEISKLLVLTYQQDFFKRFGFQLVEKETLPHKIWRACLNCPRFPNCDEIAMVLDL